MGVLNKINCGFAPPERLTTSEWAEKYFQLPPTSAEPGNWYRDRCPPQQGIMDAPFEKGINKVTLMCSAQIGKTTIGNATIARFMHLDPCAMMLTQPTIQMAERYSKEKLAPMLQDISVLSDRVLRKTRNSNSTILMKLFPGGFLSLSGANSPSSLASSSIRLFLGDEVDKYPPSAGNEGDPVKLAVERTNTFWNRLIFLYSTPSIKGASRIEKSFLESDQRYYFVPCPECGHEQNLIWERIEYAEKGTERADPESGVYYICEKCYRPIAENQKPKMLRAGKWKATVEPKDKRHAGFHLNRLYSPWVSWVDIALDFEASRKDPQQHQVFVNATLGLPYEVVAGEQLEWQKLEARGRSANYKKGFVPNGALLLTAGVDVQGDRLECSIWGWGRGEQAWLIDHIVMFGDTLGEQVWNQLETITTKLYKHESGGVLRIRATCIDSGYRTQDVYQQIRKRAFLHWFAVKGVSGQNKPIIAVPRYQEINHRGERIKRGIKLYAIGVDLAKETLYARSRIEEPGAKFLNFPNDLDSNWYEGFCSEVQVQKHKNGQAFYVWEKLSGVRNEALDTSVYALAAAHLVGLSRIKSKEEEKDLIVEKVVTETSNQLIKKAHSQMRIRRKANGIKVY
ncbi:MAG: phage terminase large subunit family protein [Xenococcaceae cyanobacterium]